MSPHGELDWRRVAPEQAQQPRLPSEVQPWDVLRDSPGRTGHRGLETSGPAEGCNHQSGPVWRFQAYMCIDAPGQEHSGVQGEAPYRPYVSAHHVV